MRLIDVNTLELKEFFGRKTPPYAILSHTWGDEEVTFQEWEHRTDNTVKRKEGYAKIMGACRRALVDGFEYLWCDTNCIDKRSSAELSEAINSMFAWYHDSVICYAYLADIKPGGVKLADSRWFARGWTLQELLAPARVVFFDRQWNVLGYRKELASLISETARIHIGALADRETIRDYSVAQRMSWAADRQTSRSEDIAYCLLGIFDINMPLLYGEGSKAFTRLQREIINVSNDQSILAWDLRYPNAQPWTSALALSPSEFRFCGSIVRNHETQRASYSITNLGISMRLALIKTLVGGMVLVGLNCARELYKEASDSRLPDGTKLRRHFRIWITLRHLKHDTYVRVHHSSSKIYLEQSYPTLAYPLLTDLFLSLNPTPAHPTDLVKSPAELLRQHSSYNPSGIFVSVASGKMTSHGRTFGEVYPLGNIIIIQLKRQYASRTSHQLVSCGDLSVIISVFWDEHGSPQEWLHTVIFDPKLKVSSQMTSQDEWKCLFEADNHGKGFQSSNSAITMHSLHRKLQRVNRELLSTYVEEEKDPIVIIEKQPLKDMFGQPELMVEVIFRETPRYRKGV
ncbi:HET-domain-containing protein [Hypoxylon crocopeplum]|nr:HET-domain-containing protein [Hypoxylon crocopeplum]